MPTCTAPWLHARTVTLAKVTVTGCETRGRTVPCTCRARPVLFLLCMHLPKQVTRRMQSIVGRAQQSVCIARMRTLYSDLDVRAYIHTYIHTYMPRVGERLAKLPRTFSLLFLTIDFLHMYMHAPIYVCTYPSTWCMHLPRPGRYLPTYLHMYVHAPIYVCTYPSRYLPTHVRACTYLCMYLPK